jgi:hypothetical protein
MKNVWLKERQPSRYILHANQWVSPNQIFVASFAKHMDRLVESMGSMSIEAEQAANQMRHFLHVHLNHGRQ